MYFIQLPKSILHGAFHVLLNNCWMYLLTMGFDLPPSLRDKKYTVALNRLLSCSLPTAHNSIPLSTALSLIPLSKAPTLSPACA